MRSLIPCRFRIFKNIWNGHWIAEDLSKPKAFHSTETWDECIAWCENRATTPFVGAIEGGKRVVPAANLLK